MGGGWVKLAYCCCFSAKLSPSSVNKAQKHPLISNNQSFLGGAGRSGLRADWQRGSGSQLQASVTSLFPSLMQGERCHPSSVGRRLGGGGESAWPMTSASLPARSHCYTGQLQTAKWGNLSWCYSPDVSQNSFLGFFLCGCVIFLIKVYKSVQQVLSKVKGQGLKRNSHVYLSIKHVHICRKSSNNWQVYSLWKTHLWL